MPDVPKNSIDALARYLITRGREKPKLVGGSTAGGRNLDDVMTRLLPMPLGDEGDVLTVIDDSGDLVPSWEPPTGGGGTTIVVQEGDSTVDGSVGTLDFDASDFNITSSPAGEANIALAYGTSAGTPAEGNHTHAAQGITVEEGDVAFGTNITTLDFDASDFNVVISPAGEANLALAYGTSSGTPAEGNHSHANDHVAVTVSDTSSIDLTLTGQALSAAIIDEYVQDVVGSLMVDSSSIDFTYDDGANTLTAAVIDSYINSLIATKLLAIIDPDAVFTDPTNWVYTHRYGFVSANPQAATFTSVYLALTNQGTPSADDAADGNWILFTSATGANSTAGLTAVAHGYYADWSLTVIARIKTGTITGCRIWSCFQGSVSPTLTDTPNGSFVGFRFSTVAGDTNWQCMSGNSSANTQTTDSGVAVAADTPYQMRIVFGTGRVRFYIDEVLVADHSTHRPATVTRLANHGTVITNTVGGAGTARTIRVMRVLIATVK